MKKILIYDLPTRVFHALFAISFVLAFSIAKFLDDESALYGIHMILGLFMTYLVFTRIAWGFFGSEHSKFKSLILSPNSLISYFKNISSKDGKIYNGHNPASSYLLIGMIIFTLGLSFSGYQMVNKNNKEFFEEIHEVFAHLFLIGSILHILGIALHQFKHKDFIGLSILTGHKYLKNSHESIATKSKNLTGAIYLTISLVLFLSIFKNYNQITGELNLLGNKYLLVKIESEKEKENESEKENDND